MPTIITYFTDDYEHPAQALERSAQHFGHPFIGRRIVSRGSWRMNVAVKPLIISDMMQTISDGTVVVFCDADGIIMRDLSFLDTLEVDIAATDKLLKNRTRHEWLSGVMFFRVSSVVRQFFRVWARKSMHYAGGTRPDQRSLGRSLACMPQLRIGVLARSLNQYEHWDIGRPLCILSGRWSTYLSIDLAEETACRYDVTRTEYDRRLEQCLKAIFCTPTPCK